METKIKDYDFSKVDTNSLKARLGYLTLISAYANYDTSVEDEIIQAVQEELNKRGVKTSACC